MSKYLNRALKGLTPYTPGEQPKDKKYIKLNTNENPYPPSSIVIEEIKKAADKDLNLYPPPNADKLIESAASYYGLDKDQVFAGNGSDEVLAMSFMAFFEKGREVYIPDITYSFYDVYCNLFGIKYKEVPLEDDFSISPSNYKGSDNGVIIANPNAPTGLCMSLDDIKIILKGNKDNVVIIDEAYIDFGGESSIGLINEYDNLLITTTLSKSRSLAGLRLGFAFGQSELIDGLNMVKNSFNSYTIGRVAQAGGAAAFLDDKYFNMIKNRIIEGRAWTSNELKKLDFDVINSKANFLFASHKDIKAKEIFKKLRDKGILVRYFDKPRIDNYIRITIGTKIEMKELIKKLKDILYTI